MTTEKSEEEQLAEIKEKLSSKRESNKRAYMDLMRMGAELDPNAMLMVRFDVLVDLLLSDTQRALFELAFEQRLGTTIEQAKMELRRETITQPVKRPGLILPD